MLVRILLAGHSASSLKRWRRIVDAEDVSVTSIVSKRTLWQSLPQQDADFVIINKDALYKPEEAAVAALKHMPGEPDVIIVTDREDAHNRAVLLAGGCTAVLNDELQDNVLVGTLSAIVQARRQRMLNHLRANQVNYGFSQARLSDFVSTSPAMRAFMDIVYRIVDAQSPLLITGETGVGKEHLARAIHLESARARWPFVAVNCGALPEGLMESELFGHEEGAFTGASRARRGFFELAHQGTIFLDEIGDMPVHLQVKLLRVLQEGIIQRVGSERTTSLNVRVMAATNRDLAGEIDAKRFRPDLYYRLAVVTLAIPPLRERSEDIPELVSHYIDHFRAVLKSKVTGISHNALQALIHYRWPGNIRELINVVERAMLLCAGDEMTVADLSPAIANLDSGAKETHNATASEWCVNWLDKPWRTVRDDVLQTAEHRYLHDLLRATRGRICEAAKRAGMNVRSIHRKMAEHGLDKNDFRGDQS